MTDAYLPDGSLWLQTSFCYHSNKMAPTLVSIQQMISGERPTAHLRTAGREGVEDVMLDIQLRQSFRQRGIDQIAVIIEFANELPKRPVRCRRKEELLHVVVFFEDADMPEGVEAFREWVREGLYSALHGWLHKH